MAASITVRYYVNERKDGLQGYALRVVAVNAVDMPKEIFVFQRRVQSATDPQENSADDFFIKVAEPNALEEYPVEPPKPTDENPYYRRAEVTLIFRSQHELQDTRELIATCISGLVLALQAAAATNEMTEVTYG